MMQGTSLDAYHTIKALGQLNPRQQKIFDQLLISGCCTNEKLSDLLGLPINQVPPRILELRRKGLVKMMYQEPGKSGRMANVWGVVHA